MKWIIFDLGGVLADERPFDEVSLSRAVEYCVERGYVVDFGAVSAFRAVLSQGPFRDRTSHALHRSGVPDAIARAASDNLYESDPSSYYKYLVPDAALVGGLSRISGLAGTCISGNQHPQVLQWLERHCLKSRVDACHFNFELGAAKPSVEFFCRLADKLGARPVDCLYVGDRVDNDVVPALAAGMSALRLTGTGEYACQALDAFGAQGAAEAADGTQAVELILEWLRIGRMTTPSGQAPQTVVA